MVPIGEAFCVFVYAGDKSSGMQRVGCMPPKTKRACRLIGLRDQATIKSKYDSKVSIIN